MKFTVAQIKKRVHQDPTFEEVLDLSAFVPKDDDVIDVQKTHISGEMSIDGEDELFNFDLHIKTTLIVACARTLKPVELPLDFTVRETFSHDETDEYRLIDGITIDLSPIIWSNIYLEKPMRIIHPDAKDMDDFTSAEDADKKPKVNPQLAKLKDYKS